MCPQTTPPDLQAPAPEIVCHCLHCSPTHIPHTNATPLTRLRCLLLNWIHSSQFLTDPPCEHVEFFNSFYSFLDISKEENTSDCRTFRAIGLHDDPEASNVQMFICTHKYPPGYGYVPSENGVEYRDDYGVFAVIKVVDAERKLTHFIQEDGERDAFVAFTATWQDGDAGNNVEEMRIWEKVVELLRKATDASYDRAGEFLDVEEGNRRIAAISSPVKLLAIIAE
jgi:hypothetical protein